MNHKLNPNFFSRNEGIKSVLHSEKEKSHLYRSAPSTSLNRGTSPSAPGGTRPRRDSAKELATTHPSTERHLRDHAAAAFKLTPLTFADTRPRKNWAASGENRPPTSAATTTRRARLPLPTSSGYLLCCMASCSPIRSDGRHQRGVDCP